MKLFQFATSTTTSSSPSSSRVVKRKSIAQLRDQFRRSRPDVRSYSSSGSCALQPELQFTPSPSTPPTFSVPSLLSFVSSSSFPASYPTAGIAGVVDLDADVTLHSSDCMPAVDTDLDPLDIDLLFDARSSCAWKPPPQKRLCHRFEECVDEVVSFASESSTNLSPLSLSPLDEEGSEDIFPSPSTWTSTSTFTSTASSSSESALASDSSSDLTNVEIADRLEQLGLHQFLQFSVSRQEAHMKTAINRFANLIEWLVDFHDAFRSCTLLTLESYIKSFIGDHYDLFPAYVQYLSEHKHYQPATVVGHIDDIRTCCNWFVMFRKTVPEHTRMKQYELLGFLACVKHVRRVLNKKVNFNSFLSLCYLLHVISF